MGAKPLADACYFGDTAAGRVRPLIDARSPVLSRGVRVSRHEMHVEVGRCVAEDESVDVLRPLAGHDGPAEACGCQAQGLTLSIREVGQAGSVAGGLDQDVAEIGCGLSLRYQGVGREDKVIPMDRAPGHQDFSSLLAADEACRGWAGRSAHGLAFPSWAARWHLMMRCSSDGRATSSNAALRNAEATPV